MGLARQAKTLTPTQVGVLLQHVKSKRWSERNTVIVMMSYFVGLRAKEIAGLRWSSVMDGQGNIIDAVAVTNDVAKGKSGGRTVPLRKDVMEALRCLHRVQEAVSQEDFIIQSERGWKQGVSARSIVNAFSRWFDELGMVGCSSHSGRRTFITNAAKKVVAAGGSLRDVQQMAGHSSLTMTQRYIEGDSEAKKRLVEML